MKRSGPRQTYKGTINPTSLKHPEKYEGNLENITYRSMWERNVMYWLDENPNVAKWASEELFFFYDHPVTGKRSRYFPDFYVKMIDGVQRVIEVKPKKETTIPIKPSRQTKKYINEVATWMVNQEKWRTAESHCKKANLTFELWTEETLDQMGIMKSRKLKPLDEAKTRPHKRMLRPKLTRPKRPRPSRKS